MRSRSGFSRAVVRTVLSDGHVHNAKNSFTYECDHAHCDDDVARRAARKPDLSVQGTRSSERDAGRAERALTEVLLNVSTCRTAMSLMECTRIPVAIAAVPCMSAI